MIIGLTGRNCSGKGEAARFLETKGFCHYSLSDVIRTELENSGLELTRNSLVDVGNALRAEHGHDILARRTMKRIEGDRNYVIDSIRHPLEVKALRELDRFTLLAIRADPEVRFRRIQERGRESDPATFEEFNELDARESDNEGSERQQLNATESRADFSVDNNGDLAELESSLSRILQRLMGNVNRPDWDEYFMRIAKVASLRSNCVKRKVAAIIVRDKRVIATGYNGTPRGTKNCYEGGCPRCNNLADSGTRLEECLCSHGEENALIQAAYHGVSVRHGTLYTTFAPCLMCTKMIINAGISEVVYNLEYPLNETSFKLLNEAGVVCRQHSV